MTLEILFQGGPDSWAEYRAPLHRALTEAGLEFSLAPETVCPEQVDYVVYAPSSGLVDFAPFTGLRAVLSLWAGVEKIVGNRSIRVPLTRMVDDGLTEGMVEWVVGHVLRHHLNIDHALAHQSGAWVRHIPPLARHRPVTVLGLGALGAACARQLAALNFPVTGWSRTPREIPGVTCLSGTDGLVTALQRAEILVLLLPLTPDTESLIDAKIIARLPRNAVILNPGRGQLIDDDALLDALDTGHVGHATLDVFRAEPLPAGHPFWTHPRVTVTPHIASETRPETASQVIAENIRRCESGLPLLHLVDRDLGY